MNLPAPRLAYAGAERTIAATRLLLAALALFANWFDPHQPAAGTPPPYLLYPGYLAYAGLIAAIVWSRTGWSWLPTATFVVDLAILSAFDYLITTSPSPIFMYFVFVLFCAPLRWGWAGALRIIPFSVGALVVGGSLMTRGLALEEFELHHSIIRVGYLAMIGALLVYLGRYEASRRNEIQPLARWPSLDGADESNAVRAFLEYGTRRVRARGGVVVWSINDEPQTRLAHCTPSGFGMVTHGPAVVDPAVAPALGSAPFLCASRNTTNPSALVRRRSAVEVWKGMPVRAAIANLLDGASSGSAALAACRLSGRVFFTWSECRSVDVLPLLEAVARQTGTSLDQMHARVQQRRLAVAEERMRPARDLHDGVLQSLTDVRFEMQRLWRESEKPADGAERLLAMERTLADEPRELRFYIEGLKPPAGLPAEGSVRRRVSDLRGRLSTQWHVPFDAHVDDPLPDLPMPVSRAIAPMVHEAVVSALKHGAPSRVRVAVQRVNDALEVAVTDDDRGFDFQGGFDHNVLTARQWGPASLRDRPASLGGQLAIQSSALGARVLMGLPCGPSRN